MSRIPNKKINPLVNELFPEEDLQHKYKVKKIIGKGQYGYVAKAVQKKTNEYVAIKKLINIFQNEFQTKRILREIVLLKNCKHPNIVSLIQVMIPSNQTLDNFNTIYIVTEYCQADLRKLFQTQEVFLSINDVKYILYQIVCGIKYLHSASIIHRDLTPSNILINGQGMRIKICDLGLARIVEKNEIQNPVENSQDQQILQQEIKNLSIQERQAIKKQIFNTFQNIDSESLPSTPNTQSKINSPTFDESSQFIMKRRHSNEIIKSNQEQQKAQNNLKLSGNLDDLRGSQKTEHQQKQTNNKKRKLKRQDSKRSDNGISLSQTTSQKQKTQELSPKQQKKQLKKGLPNNPIAKLTLRVTTRWYRAPQVILLQKGYHKPIDIWSLGCLFGQLLKMMKSVCYNSLQRFPLFPGKYCYPVSPATLCNINRQGNDKVENTVSYKNDQLFMILSTIGKPSQQQMQFLTDEGAKNYLRNMEELKRKQFRKFFPNVAQQAIEILEKTLLFNPNDRYKIEDIINHPFLSDMKNKQMQKQAPSIIMQFQQEQNLNLQILKKYLANEIKPYV